MTFLGKSKTVLFFLVFLLQILVFPQIIKAEVGEGTPTDLQKQLDENRQEQEKTKQLLGETRQKKLTLQNEISYQENQIKLTTLKIEETKHEIEVLTGQIDQLEVDLSTLSRVFSERVVETYKLRRLGDSVLLLLGSGNISEFISRFTYLQRIQENDRELLLKMQGTQTTYVDRRDQVQTLQDRLRSQQNTLARQKMQKENLLKVTQNDEKKYQDLLASLKADESAIERALSSLIARIVSGIATGAPVTKGQIIGQEGNTGNVYPRPSGSCPQCGAHLHFMVMPCNIINNGGLSCHSDPSSYLDNGEYRKPLDFAGGWRDYITQGYGYTSFAQSGAYNGAPHSGIDLITDFGGNRGGYGAPVYAIANGTVYYGVDSAGGKYALVKHKDDLWSAYWHLQ